MYATVTTPEHLAKALKERRTQQGVTQKAVGAKSKLLPKTISALETEPGPSSIGSLLRLLAELDLVLVLKDRVST